LSTVLSIHHLTKRFGSLCAVNNLSLEVKSGQVFGLLGPNGSGKTTTLGMLMGVVNPTSGSHTWFGRTPDHQVRKHIGAVLEHPIFYPYLSGQRNLELSAMVRQCDPANISHVLDIVELTKRKDDPFKTYSLGMKQRLAIASALLNDSKVLILDEPTNGLDPMGIADIRALITRIANTGKTIILASHLLDEVQKVCTHFAVMKRGNLKHVGPVEDASAGTEMVEVKSTHESLEDALKTFDGIDSYEVENDRYILKLKPHVHSEQVNQYLFNRGIVLNHLVAKKRSLEEMFLEILSQ
jgi:ABC-type multidrug transport system ATPase subunit